MQYRRMANVYFLLIAILSSIPRFEAINPTVIWLPMLFVLTFSIIKEAKEDWSRRNDDYEVNWQNECLALRNSIFEIVKWGDIIVGDLCCVKQEETFPCDLVLIASSRIDGTAYIETASLDGEKTLKARYANDLTNSYRFPELLQHFQGIWHGIEPNKELHNFHSKLTTESSTIHYHDDKQLLYRNAKLKNTEWIYGLAIYTGANTKQMMNSHPPTAKYSQLENKLNFMIIGLVVLQVMFCMIVAILFRVSYEGETMRMHSYISWTAKSNESIGSEAVSIFFIYFVSLSTMVPVSLIISLDIVKMAQSYFINVDKLMYSSARKQGSIARCASLNEELGQVEHIFSDKTGTLTKNIMSFETAVIGHEVYTFKVDNHSEYACSKMMSQLHENEPIPINDLIIKNKEKTEILLFDDQRKLIDIYLTALSITHEVFTVTNEESPRLLQLPSYTYQSLSPDELAFVHMTKSMFYQFLSIKHSTISLNINYQPQSIHLHHKFPFTSHRKRMSIIIQYADKIIMFIKGVINNIIEADDCLLPRMAADSKLNLSSILTNLSNQGLRVMLLAMRIISLNEYTEFVNKCDAMPAESIQKLSEPLIDQLEHNLYLIGAMAVSDELQDDVASTIKDICSADIKFWMLTGDKRETAEQIARSCGIIKPNTMLYRLTVEHVQDNFVTLQEEIAKKPSYAQSLILEGTTLASIIENPALHSLFATLSTSFSSLICCRLLPLQKSQIVTLIQTQLKIITLSIGDGGNDVPMLTTSNIGIGISGEEGLSAVLASDYALPEFRMLWRLLFLHGRWNYIRISEMICYFVYKNLLFTIPRAVYAMYSMQSGTPFFDSMYIALYSVIFTALPVLIRGMFEQDVNYVYKKEENNNKICLEDTSIGNRNKEEKHLPEKFAVSSFVRKMMPKAYFIGKNNTIFNAKNVLFWISEAVIEALVVTMLVIELTKSKSINNTGINSDLWIASLTTYTTVILMVSFKLATHSKHWTVFLFLALGMLSIVPYFTYLWISNYAFSSQLKGTTIILLSSPKIYLIIIFCCTLLLLLDGIIIYYKHNTENMMSKLRNIVSEAKLNEIESKRELEQQSDISSQTDRSGKEIERIQVATIISSEPSIAKCKIKG